MQVVPRAARLSPRLSPRAYHASTRLNKLLTSPLYSTLSRTIPPAKHTTSSSHLKYLQCRGASPAARSLSTSTTSMASAQQLTQQIQSRHASLADASALANTVSFLQSLASSSSASASLSFDPTTLLLKPVFPTSPSQPAEDGGDASHELREFTQLAVDAQQRAFAESYSSALVGEGNEADDMSDVAFWVPAAPEEVEDSAALASAGDAGAILRGLGLDGVGEASEPEPSKLVVPEGVRLTVTGLPDSRVIVLEGRRVAGGWAGLIGVGVWS